MIIGAWNFLYFLVLSFVLAQDPIANLPQGRTVGVSILKVLTTVQYALLCLYPRTTTNLNVSSYIIPTAGPGSPLTFKLLSTTRPKTIWVMVLISYKQLSSPTCDVFCWLE